MLIAYGGTSDARVISEQDFADASLVHTTVTWDRSNFFVVPLPPSRRRLRPC